MNTILVILIVGIVPDWETLGHNIQVAKMQGVNACYQQKMHNCQILVNQIVSFDTGT